MHHDVVIVGGSFAGLSAAMQLARGRARVALFDTGKPRNRFSPHAHGFFALDGVEPAKLARDARDKVLAYPTVKLFESAVTDARAIDGGFLINGEMTARKLILAYGISDIMPQIPGLADRWGTTVLHCPYCHGYEVKGALGVLGTHGFHAALIANWGPTTLFTNGEMIDEETRVKLGKRNIAIVAEKISAIEGSCSVRLENGTSHDLGGLFIGAKTRPNSDLASKLGCAIDDGMLGPVIRADTWRLTTVPGVYAAGDIAREPHNATWASADGVSAGAAVHRELVLGDY